VRKSHSKRPLEHREGGWVDNIKINIGEIGQEDGFMSNDGLNSEVEPSDCAIVVFISWVKLNSYVYGVFTQYYFGQMRHDAV
jgi:hypothetical protein